MSTLQNPFWDWAVTATFYAAVHYVEAYFAKCKPPIHSTLHKTRDSSIQRDPVLKPLYSTYRELENQSRNARYEAHIPFTQAEVTESASNLAELKKVLVPLL